VPVKAQLSSWRVGGLLGGWPVGVNSLQGRFHDKVTSCL
jgi:hypothetical protein